MNKELYNAYEYAKNTLSEYICKYSNQSENSLFITITSPANDTCVNLKMTTDSEEFITVEISDMIYMPQRQGIGTYLLNNIKNWPRVKSICLFDVVGDGGRFLAEKNGFTRQDGNYIKNIYPIEILETLEKEEESLIDIYLDLFLEIASDINKDVFLKGNVLLNKLYPKVARATVDLDMSTVSKELYYTGIVSHLEFFGERLVEEGKASRYEIEEISERKSEGIKIYDSKNTTVYSVDVSLSERSLLGIMQYDFGGSLVYASSIEKILCDKCLSTLSRKRFRRIKDFYDLYIILNSKVSYDARTVTDLMIEKLGIEEVTSLLNNYPFTEEIITQATYAWDKLKLVNILSGIKIDKTDFTHVLNKVYVLYDRIEANVK